MEVGGERIRIERRGKRIKERETEECTCAQKRWWVAMGERVCMKNSQI